MYLTNFMVKVYRPLLEVVAWLWLLAGLVTGAQYGGFWGAVGGLVVAFLACTVTIGLIVTIVKACHTLEDVKAQTGPRVQAPQMEN